MGSPLYSIGILISAAPASGELPENINASLPTASRIPFDSSLVSIAARRTALNTASVDSVNFFS